jgi:hypothetical protein
LEKFQTLKKSLFLLAVGAIVIVQLPAQAQTTAANVVPIGDGNTITVQAGGRHEFNLV